MGIGASSPVARCGLSRMAAPQCSFVGQGIRHKLGAGNVPRNVLDYAIHIDSLPGSAPPPPAAELITQNGLTRSCGIFSRFVQPFGCISALL